MTAAWCSTARFVPEEPNTNGLTRDFGTREIFLHLNTRCIEITVSRTLECSADQAYRVLWDWEHFPEWWSLPVTFHQNGGSVIRFKPIPFIEIEWVRLGGESPRVIRCEYRRGP